MATSHIVRNRAICYFCDMPATRSLLVTPKPEHADVLRDRFGDHWFQNFCDVHFDMVFAQCADLTVPCESLIKVSASKQYRKRERNEIKARRS